jgi:LacI family transcriptional regulator
MDRAPEITIKDIARRADVGVGTVSRVLNDSPNVSPATREKVRRVMAEVGYRPKSAAKTLRTRRAQEIGFITDEIASTPFAVDTIRGAQDAAWEMGKLLVLINTNNNPELLRAAIETMLERQVEGLIFATWFHRMVELPANIFELPAALVDCFVAERNLPSVVPDEVLGGYEATEVLLKEGHRRIGFLNNHERQPASFGRLEGYQRALAAYDVPYLPELVSYISADADGGYAGASALMQHPEPPTALFCFNDRSAMGAYDALRDLKLAVPRDVAIVSFDNQELIAAHLRPSLTTMQLPHYAMGVWAVNYLLRPLGEASPVLAPQIQLPCPVVLRESHRLR